MQQRILHFISGSRSFHSHSGLMTALSPVTFLLFNLVILTESNKSQKFIFFCPAFNQTKFPFNTLQPTFSLLIKTCQSNWLCVVTGRYWLVHLHLHPLYPADSTECQVSLSPVVGFEYSEIPAVGYPLLTLRVSSHYSQGWSGLETWQLSSVFGICEK